MFDRAEASLFLRELAGAVREHVSAEMRPIGERLAALEARAPVNGRDGTGIDSGIVNGAGCLILRLTDGKELELGKVRGDDGKSVDEASLRSFITTEGERIIAEIPKPQDGKDGAAGVDGKNGVDGKDGADGKQGADGRDGKDADPVEVERLVVVEVKKQVEALPKPVDVTGATIDREGTLILVLSNGTTKEVGRVVGRDADVADMKRIIGEEVSKFPKPRDGIDGKDGFGFDDMSVEHDGERGFVFKFQQGERAKEFPVVVPVVLDRGVWREGKYAKGDGVTLGGSFFIAQCETEARPETSPDWRLSVKRGRDGKDGKAGPKGEPGQAGRAGRDLTQVLTDGTKY